MEKDKLVPERRFQGYTEGWGKKGLNEVVSHFAGGASIKPSDYQKKGVSTIPKGAVNSTGIADLSGSKYISYGFFKKNVASKVISGELVTSLRDLIPSAPNLGRVVKIKGVGDSFLMPQGVYKLSLQNEVDERFIISLSNSRKFREEIMKEKSGSTQVHIRNGDFLKIKINVPNYNEQQKIGAFFKVLDERIANQERKIAKVKALKSAYLTEMFPQEGETVPKRRFKRFEDEWLKETFIRLLDESESIRRGPFGSALKKDLFVDNSDFVIYEQQNAIYDHYKYRYHITEAKYEELIRFSLNEGDFIMSGAGTIGAISRVPKGIQPGVINQALIRIRINSKKTDSEYFLQWIRSDSMQKRLKEANPASAMENLIPMSELKEWDIEIPSLEEQQKVGAFFKNLDNQIEMEEKKLDKLQKMKEAYLEEMFV